MDHNLITNLETCLPSLMDVLNGNLNLLYYSHLPTIIISLFLGFFVLFKSREKLLSRVFFFLSLVFALWSILDLYTWLSFDTRIIMFTWSLTGLVEVLFFVLSFYFLYVFFEKKDVLFRYKLLGVIILLPLIIMIPLKLNLLGFNSDGCYALENNYSLYYKYFIEIILSIIIVIFSLIKIRQQVDKNLRKQLVFLFWGIMLFLFSFFSAVFLSGYLVDAGWGVKGYSVEIYGLFGTIIFMAFLAYLIVKFKAFNIKLIGAQALVWSLIIIIGSQFAFIQNPTNKILTTITLIISGVVGLMIVRGVKKEIFLREKLEVANAGQANLIHLMNHQIKGYLTISKNVLAELLTDDYGKVPEEAKEIITKGLESSNRGVRYVTDILKGASAESGTLTYNMQKIDFKEIVLTTIESRKEIIENKKLKLEVDIADGDYNMTGDRSQLGEAVRNLIENSVYYTIAGGIAIHLKHKAGKILFSVKDTGVGIKHEDRSKIFKAGGVGSDSIKINVNSSGYGLAFVKGVVEKHNGKAWFESAGAGHGSTFFVELPVE